MSTSITVVGVDPGLAGGVAAISGGRVVHADRLPVRTIDVGHRSRRLTDGDRLAALLADLRPDVVYVEEAHARTGRGRRGKAGGEGGDSAPTAFAFGGNWSIVVDRCIAHGLVVVAPRQWQRSMLVIGDPSRAGTKAASVAFCRHFFPDVDLAPGKLREPHDGIADAVAICHYGYLQETGINAPPRVIRRPARGRRRA